MVELAVKVLAVAVIITQILNLFCELTGVREKLSVIAIRAAASRSFMILQRQAVVWDNRIKV